MYIYWLGESSFKIKTDKEIVIIDPSHKSTGLTQAALEADLVLLSGTMPTDLTRVKQNKTDKKPFVISSPGEYEIQNIFVYGIPSSAKTILYLIRMEGIEIAHLAGLTTDLTDKQLEFLEGADILMVPVGGKGTLNSKQADSVISQIEPSVVIPMNYQVDKLTIERELVDKFLTEMGAKGLQPQTSLHITKSKLQDKEMQLVLLTV